jgi:tetratricopeptide (TPR) repeat protein
MRRFLLIILACTAATGCAFKPRPKTAATRAAATRPADPALFSLADIQPKPVLSTTRPATMRTGKAPLEALELFAQGRDALLQGQAYTAIAILEKAIKLDPQSYDLRYALGQAYAGMGGASDQSIQALRDAADIEPDHLDLQTELGRQYLVKRDLDKAIQHLFLAMQTADYKADVPGSAVADFYLASALRQRGYLSAATECYKRLIERLRRGGMPVRMTPELAYLVNQPEKVYEAVAELYEKIGRFDDAAAALEEVARRRPERFDVRKRLVHMLVQAQRQSEGVTQAERALRDFHASAESIALLNELYDSRGGGAALAQELSRLHGAVPDDRAVLFALVDTLEKTGRASEAENVLEQAAPQTRYDIELVARLFKMYQKRADVSAAARLVVEALAHRPDSIRDLDGMWTELTRYSARHRLTVSQLQGLEVSPEAQASRLLWLWRLGERWNRDLLARSSLEQSARISPPFAPACRLLVGDYANRTDWDQARRNSTMASLISSVRSQGDLALAAELEGLALGRSDPSRAAAKFAEALKRGAKSTDLRLSYAKALHDSGKSELAEQVLWKIVEDEPRCEDAYGGLFDYYLSSQSIRQAMAVLQKWLASNPNSVNAKLLQSAVLLQTRHPDEAERILLDLVARDPDNTAVLNAMNAFYVKIGKVEEFIAKLEAERTAHPENRIAIEELVLIYSGQKRLPEAIRVLDAARAAVARDPDLLYYVGSLYTRVGEKKTTEQILSQVVALDPTHAPASNDLGYTWADRGENLPRAEELIRIALKAEPDNQSYLDSLGWALYKRGRFDEARKYLDDAIAPASFPDPIVLDHMGDTLYRLGRRDEAIRHWKRSQERLGQSDGDRDELKQLRLQLQEKLKQAEAGQSVNVAPVAEGPGYDGRASLPASRP